MKILTNKQYKEALAEERERAWEAQRIERSINEINERFWGLERRVNELEVNKSLETAKVI